MNVTLKVKSIQYGKIIPEAKAQSNTEKTLLQCISASKPKWSYKRRHKRLIHFPESGAGFFASYISDTDSEDIICRGTLLNGQKFEAFAKIFVSSKFNKKL